MGIILVIDDGVYVCIYNVYSPVFKEYTKHTFIYDSHFQQWDNSEGCGAIIGNISHIPIYVPEENNRKRKTALNNILKKILWRKMYCELCFQSYCKWFFVTLNVSLLIIILNIDLTIWKIEDEKLTKKEIYCRIDWIWQYFRIMHQSLRGM